VGGTGLEPVTQLVEHVSPVDHMRPARTNPSFMQVPATGGHN
jgi:hypothetical protein